MRLAAFNVENLFERPAAMNLANWEEGRAVLQDFAELTNLIAKDTYSPVDKDRMLEIMRRHPGLLANRVSRFLRLREYRKRLVRKPTSQPHEIAVDGREDWIGWFELVEEPIRAAAIENTARIVREVNADVLCVVEADDRVALKHFNDDVLARVDGTPYDSVMLIDGNDERGIDVGLLTRATAPIGTMRSHVDDEDGGGAIFSRDCPEFLIELAGGERLLVLGNHFKSKGFGSASSSNAKRRRQAERVREIYEARRTEGLSLIAVLGDLNDLPDSDPLAPLVADGSDLVDVMVHPQFTGDGRPGTFANGTKSGKLDYILLSPALSARVGAGGIERRGVWGGVNGTLFPHLPEIKTEKDAASDHAALWVDFT